MNTMQNICIALSAGLIVGFFCGGIKSTFFRKEYSEKKVAATHKLINKAAGVLKYFTFMLLLMGLL